MRKLEELLGTDILSLNENLDLINEIYNRDKNINPSRYLEAIKIIDNKLSLLTEIAIPIDKKSKDEIQFAIAPNIHKSYGNDAYFKIFKKDVDPNRDRPCWRVYMNRPEYNTSHTPMEKAPMKDYQRDQIIPILTRQFADQKHYQAVYIAAMIDAKKNNIFLDLEKFYVNNWQALIYYFNTLTNDKEYISYFTSIPNYNLLPNKY